MSEPNPRPPYDANRFLRCIAKAIRYRAAAIRHPRDWGAWALADYYEREARKVQA